MFAITIRVDVIKELTFLATLTHRCGPRAQTAYRHIIAYLHEYPAFPMNLRTDEGDIVVAYADASYANHVDAKSHSGMFVTIGNNSGPIAVNSKKQKMVTRTTSESELLSLSGAINQGAGIAKFLHEVKLIEQGGFEIRQDNKSTITIAVDEEGMGVKMRHFRVRHEFMREMHRDKKMMIDYLCN